MLIICLYSKLFRASFQALMMYRVKKLVCMNKKLGKNIELVRNGAYAMHTSHENSHFLTLEILSWC